MYCSDKQIHRLLFSNFTYFDFDSFDFSVYRCQSPFLRLQRESHWLFFFFPYVIHSFFLPNLKVNPFDFPFSFNLAITHLSSFIILFWPLFTSFVVFVMSFRFFSFNLETFTYLFILTIWRLIWPVFLSFVFNGYSPWFHLDSNV